MATADKWKTSAVGIIQTLFVKEGIFKTVKEHSEVEQVLNLKDGVSVFNESSSKQFHCLKIEYVI